MDSDDVISHSDQDGYEALKKKSNTPEEHTAKRRLILGGICYQNAWDYSIMSLAS